MYGLIGSDVSQSFSKILHEKLGRYSYHLISLKPKEIDDFIKYTNFKGLNVTIPYKKDILKYCDYLSDTATLTQSVNTLVKDAHHKLWGYNTDFFGIQYTLKQYNMTVKNRTCLILGHGGSGETVKEVLISMGAKKILMASRHHTLPTLKKATAIHYNELINYRKEIHFIINTTPLGTKNLSHQSPLDLKDFPHCENLFDLNYSKKNTPLLNQGIDLGMNTINGIPMLVAQGVKSAEIFTNYQYDFKNSIEFLIKFLKTL